MLREAEIMKKGRSTGNPTATQRQRMAAITEIGCIVCDVRTVSGTDMSAVRIRESPRALGDNIGWPPG